MLKSIHRCYRRYQQLARYARSASLEIRSVATNFTPESSKLARQQFTPRLLYLLYTAAITTHAPLVHTQAP